MENFDFISSITICGDIQPKGDGLNFYKQNNTVYNNVLVEDFFNQKESIMPTEHKDEHRSKLSNRYSLDTAFGCISIEERLYLINSYIEEELYSKNKFW